MTKNRLEAFSDGVIAVIITIMVLELKVPQGASLHDLGQALPVFLSYILSFIYVGIYWNNHHHLLQLTQHVNGSVLWANLHFLFWLSLAPFATAWMGAHPSAPWPFVTYGLILLLAALAYFTLTRVLIRHHGADSALAASIGSDVKGAISLGIYVVALPLAFLRTWIAGACWIAVALMWLVPDPRIEAVAIHSAPEP